MKSSGCAVVPARGRRLLSGLMKAESSSAKSQGRAVDVGVRKRRTERGESETRNLVLARASGECSLDVHHRRESILD
jgi:hypothetical protein